ncbi:protein kinase domain containing protein [Legionella geestiana]|uniref:Protein kinase domain containing protein n=1 Tax=Legionella geestiana TaxID=45065 RepID=A0A0W0U7E4_9GAMM|nr:hypothetical protein [Legionella geestiana]KTD03832.1 protein kinase domain containing protein [Legionella geestiana]QBS11888.1 hypothetical protein E4T54_03515 [Legionella geestiana]STX53407.1 protein kinase domain containing protein [Legionella geestiana]
MPLLLPDESFRELHALVQAFNAIPEDNHVQRLFLLQKIDSAVHHADMNAALFAWYNHERGEGTESGIEETLQEYGIQLTASFFLRRMQFALAVKQHAGEERLSPAEKETCCNVADEPRLLADHQQLLKASMQWQRLRPMYIQSSLKMAHLAEASEVVGRRMDNHTELFSQASNKIRQIREKALNPHSHFNYEVKPLGKEQNNNFNFIVRFGDESAPLVMRVTDEESLSLDQKLRSEAVSKHFNEEYAQFMHVFTHDGSATYMSVALGNFANQGDLQNVAQSISKAFQGNERQKRQQIAANTTHYFKQIAKFLTELEKGGVWHPDIKLTNFLSHDNRVVVSDRKTFIETPTPAAQDMSTTVMYAAPEFADCMNRTGTALVATKATTEIAMQPYMAWQVGLALKEFMLTAIRGHKLEKTLSNEEKAVFAEAMDTRGYDISQLLPNPGYQVQNLWLLAEELTHMKAERRLSLSAFQKLLTHVNQPPLQFAALLEAEKPADEVGYSKLVAAILRRLHNRSPLDNEALETINSYFAAIYENAYTSARLAPYAKKLALYCHQRDHGLEVLSARIERALWKGDWQRASLGQKLRYWLTLTFWRVDRVTTAEMLANDDKALVTSNESKMNRWLNLNMQFELLSKPYLQVRLGEVQYENLNAYFERMRTLQEAAPQEESEVTETQPVSESSMQDRFVSDTSHDINPATMVRVDTDDESVDAFNTMVLVGRSDSPVPSSSSASVSESFSTMVVKPATMIARVLTDSSDPLRDSDNDTSSDDEKSDDDEYATTIREPRKNTAGPSPWDSLKVPAGKPTGTCNSPAASSVAAAVAPVRRLMPVKHPSVNTAMMQSLKRLSFWRQSVDDAPPPSTPVEAHEPADSLQPQLD